MSKKIFVNFLLVFVLFGLTACDMGGDQVQRVNTLKVLDTFPPLTQPLKSGEVINMRVKVAYELASDAATLTMAVLRADGFGSKSLTSTFAIIKQGKAETELKGEFIVPKKTKIIQLRVLLTPQQRTDTAPFESFTYDVIDE